MELKLNIDFVFDEMKNSGSSEKFRKLFEMIISNINANDSNHWTHHRKIQLKFMNSICWTLGQISIYIIIAIDLLFRLHVSLWMSIGTCRSMDMKDKVHWIEIFVFTSIDNHQCFNSFQTLHIINIAYLRYLIRMRYGMLPKTMTILDSINTKLIFIIWEYYFEVWTSHNLDWIESSWNASFYYRFLL